MTITVPGCHSRWAGVLQHLVQHTVTAAVHAFVVSMFVSNSLPALLSLTASGSGILGSCLPARWVVVLSYGSVVFHWLIAVDQVEVCICGSLPRL